MPNAVLDTERPTLMLKHELQPCTAESRCINSGCRTEPWFQTTVILQGFYLLSWYFHYKSELLIYGGKQPTFPHGCTMASCPCYVILFPSNFKYYPIRREENKIQILLLSLDGKFSIWLNLEDLLLFSIHKAAWFMPGDNLSRGWNICRLCASFFTCAVKSVHIWREQKKKIHF